MANAPGVPVSAPDRFLVCLPYIYGDEGGFVVDRGGPTNLGVTQKTLSEYLGRPATVAEVKALTRQSAAPIYRKLFWLPAKCDLVGQFAPGADLMHFDAAVNQGVGGSIEILQRALGIEDDGAFGPMTVMALKGFAHTHGPGALIPALEKARAASYREDAGFDVDGNGWLARDAKVAAIAAKMAQGASA